MVDVPHCAVSPAHLGARAAIRWRTRTRLGALPVQVGRDTTKPRTGSPAGAFAWGSSYLGGNAPLALFGDFTRCRFRPCGFPVVKAEPAVEGTRAFFRPSESKSRPRGSGAAPERTKGPTEARP